MDNTLSGDWDIFILLDACRYDIFNEVFNPEYDYVLDRYVSDATCTNEWIENTVDGNRYSNTIYISGNPHIRDASYGDHFKMISDVWLDGWNSEIGTIPPEELTKKLVVLSDMHEDSRFVLHFMQPHAPYICYHDDESSIDKPFTPGQLVRYPYLSKIFKFGLHFMPHEVLWRALKCLGMANIVRKHYFGRLWFDVGQQKILQGYKDNLKKALQEVHKIVELYPDKKIVVTSDHGEYLGENGYYGHDIANRNNKIREVPICILGGGG